MGGPSPPARFEPCPGCGPLFAPADLPTHRYIGASPGCWALYTPLVVGDRPSVDLLDGSRISDPDAEWPRRSGSAAAELDALLVDAYAAQHPGDDSPQAVQSVAVHLLTLHGVLQRGMPAAQALWIRRRALRKKGVFRQLAPPAWGAALTLRHTFSGGAVERPYAIGDYIESVYQAWGARHTAVLQQWFAEFVAAD